MLAVGRLSRGIMIEELLPWHFGILARVFPTLNLKSKRKCQQEEENHNLFTLCIPHVPPFLFS